MCLQIGMLLLCLKTCDFSIAERHHLKEAVNIIGTHSAHFQGQLAYFDLYDTAH